MRTFKGVCGGREGEGRGREWRMPKVCHVQKVISPTHPAYFTNHGPSPTKTETGRVLCDAAGFSSLEPSVSAFNACFFIHNVLFKVLIY